MDHQKNRALIQFLKFNVIGAVNVLLTYLLYALLVSYGWHYQIALAADYAFGICFSFFMNRYFTFEKSGQAISRMFGKMLTSYLFLFLGNILFLTVCIDALFINVYIAQLVSFGILTCVAFLLQKFFIFRLPRTLAER